MRLIKPMYGLNNAPRSWQRTADKRLKHIGFIPHRLDPCMCLSYRPDGTLDGMLSLYVDDILGIGDFNDAGYAECYFHRRNELLKIFDFG